MTATDTPDVILRRIRGLLSKAEGTDNEHERDAFNAKAFAMMDEHRVSMADLHDGQTNLGQTVYPLAATAKYLRPSLQLLTAVAKHYAVVIMVPATGNSRTPRLVGDTDDILATVIMFESLLAQRDREIMRTPVPGHLTTNAFRSSAAAGYAFRISNRLADLRKVREANASTGMELVLVNREALVLESLGAPKERNTNAPNLNGDGIRAGIDAANRADLGLDRIDHHGPRQLTGGN